MTAKVLSFFRPVPIVSDGNYMDFLTGAKAIERIRKILNSKNRNPWFYNVVNSLGKQKEFNKCGISELLEIASENAELTEEEIEENRWFLQALIDEWDHRKNKNRI